MSIAPVKHHQAEGAGALVEAVVGKVSATRGAAIGVKLISTQEKNA